MIIVEIPRRLRDRLHVALVNLAGICGCELQVRVVLDDHCSLVSASGRRVCLPTPCLESWENRDVIPHEWRGIALPQVTPLSGEYPDVLGMAYYLFGDHEEIRQELLRPGARYDISLSRLAGMCRENFLDRCVSEICNDLDVNRQIERAVILTHDVDFLSLSRIHAIEKRRAVSVGEIVGHVIGGRLRTAGIKLFGRLSAAKCIRAIDERRSISEDFEFVRWAEAECRAGVRSIYFVFADDRRRCFDGDAWYSSRFRECGPRGRTLKQVVEELLEKGFRFGPHLSRSSGYELSEIVREYESFSKTYGVPVESVRNHWVWLKYSNWDDYCRQLGVKYDFNVAANGYTKGTCYPWLSPNGQTVRFPTTYMDDVVFKPSNLGMTWDEASAELDQQLDRLERFGGCIAISFHPAEDGPPGTLAIESKVEFYEHVVLRRLAERAIPVLLPDEAAARFSGRVRYCIDEVRC